MNTMLRTTFLFLFLSSAVTTAVAQRQFTVWVEDQEGKPVKRARVTLDCGDGTIHKAGTSSKGEATFPLSGVDTCTVSITGQGLVSHSAVVAVKQSPEGVVIPVQRGSGGQNTSGCPPGQIPINGVCEIAVGTRVETQRGSGTQNVTVCPPGQMPINGVCATPVGTRAKKTNTNPQKPQDDLDAELDAVVDEEMNKPPTKSPKGGSNPNAKPNDDDLDDLLDGELDDDKPKPPVTKKPGNANDDDLDDLLDADLDDDKSKPTKPTKPLLEKYMEFWGTWRGTKVASGITFVLNPDGTGTYTDTRPGYQKHSDGRWGPNAKTGCIDAPAFRLCMHPDGTITDPWGNVYTR